MIFQQIVNEESGCLSYLVGCGRAGEADDPHDVAPPGA